jgi:hypothetical protein
MREFKGAISGESDHDREEPSLEQESSLPPAA